MDSSDFIEIIDELGQRLEGPARHLFELAVRQVYVDFFLAFGCFVIAFTAAIVVIPKALRARRELIKQRPSYFDMLSAAPTWFFAALGTGIAAFATGIWFITVVGSVLNPEWAAISKIAYSVLP